MSVYTNVAIPKTLENLLDSRDKALVNFQQIHKMLENTKQELAQYSRYLFPYQSFGGHGITYFDLDKCRRELDRRMWEEAIELTEFNRYMDAEELKNFHKSLEVDPPEFNKKNCQATFLQAASDSEEMFNRGLVNIFKRLSGNFKTNDAFKVTQKIIIDRWFTRCRLTGVSVSHYFDDEMNDFDRVIRVLVKQKFNPNEFRSLMYRAAQDGYFENEHITMKVYKKGTAHITFKSMGLVNRINDVIAEYYESNTLAA